MQTGTILSVSPSFNSYSSDTFAEIADRVVEECRAAEEEVQEDPFCFMSGREQFIWEFGEKSGTETNGDEAKVEENDDGGDGSHSEADEFEFSFMTGEKADSLSISADEIFYNGQIRPIFPVFGKDLIPCGAKLPPLVAAPGRRLPLRKLFTEERQSSLSSSPSSSSSSEVDELEGVQPGTYCVWTPKNTGSEATAVVGQQRKKSNSTGSTTSSKRWRFLEFLSRSNSDGKDIFVFLMPKKREENLKVVT